jgi:hypothetical protein
MSPDEIPDGMIAGPIGHKDDKSPAHARALRAVKQVNGEGPFEIIDGGKDDA